MPYQWREVENKTQLPIMTNVTALVLQTGKQERHHIFGGFPCEAVQPTMTMGTPTMIRHQPYLLSGKFLSHRSPFSHFYTHTAKTRAPELIIGKKSSHDVHKITTTNTLTMMVHQPHLLSGNPNPLLIARSTFRVPRCTKNGPDCHASHNSIHSKSGVERHQG
jgi:hypothetical protein